MLLHFVHFFIAMPVIPTPEPSYNTYLFVNMLQLIMQYRDSMIPASHSLRPSRP